MESAPTTQQAVTDQLGRTLRDLRVSVIDTCNLRCTYCMPADTYHEHYPFLRPAERLSFEEIVRLVRVFVRLGAMKVRLTGGEPLLRKGLPDLVATLAEVEGVEDLALTTNGLLLPQLARPLREAGLHRLTVSLDSLDDKTFGVMNGRGVPVSRVLEGIAAAEAAGFHSIKVNAVIERGVNEDSVLPLVEHFRGTGHIVRFIEYMDVGTCNGWRYEHVAPSKTLLDRIRAKYPLVPLESNYHGEVAARYGFVDGQGEVGFVSSVTEPFCGSCTRARLSAGGRLYTCLFATDGVDLRAPLRDGAGDDELLRLIEETWLARSDRYSEQRAELRASGGEARTKIEMYQIGG